MDPLSAFGIACGVIQVLDFSTKVVKKWRELYNRGATSQNEDLEELASYLAGLRENLKSSSQSDRDDLQDLGIKCSDTAEDLIRELQNLKAKGSRKKLVLMSKTFKNIWKREAIDELWKRLEEYRKILDTRVLVDLRKRFDLLSLQDRADFKSLDNKVQMLIKSLAAGPKYVDELGTLICRESESIRCHVVDEFQQHRKSLADSDYIKRFLDSLWFPEIQHRQEIIKDAHVQTFRWIYGVDGNTESAPQWDGFAEWLERGEGTYWINGKPGSGKSTLMNYIYQEKRTHDLLKAWSGEKELLVPSFFFWKAGIDMEQSIIGLLRSLLYQILAKFPDKIRLLDQMNSPCEHAHPSTHGYKPIAAWTEHRLQTTFDDVMHQMQDSCRMCIFIDGLDEFTGDQSALVETLVTMQSKAIKLCLSSRPHQSYNEAFGSYAKLKLQDLTDGDIKTFVSYKLQAWLRSVPVKDVNMIFDSIVNKAEGVFLWVELVVKDLLRGLGNNDSLDQLVERVRILPSGIEELYAHMLSDIDGIYKKEAAGLFHMAIAGLTRSLLDVSLAIYKAFDKLDELTVKDAICFCELTKERIPTVCAGLLEICSDEETWSLEHESTMFRRKIYLSLPSQCHLSHNMAKISSYERSHHLEFLHRTALDFLRESEPGKRFMTANTPLGWNPYEPYVKALLAKVSLLGFPKCHTDMKMDLRHPEEVIPEEVSQCVYVGEIMHKVVLAERYNGTAQIALCEHVDRTLTIAHQQTFGRSVDMHWYTQ